MKKFIVTLGGVTILAAGFAISPQSTNAQTNDRKYICHEPSTTVVVVNASSIQRAIPIIGFTLDTAKDQGYGNLIRCRIVASKFDAAYREGRLKYLQVDSIRVREGVTLPVLCGLKSKNDPCNRASILYTILNPVTNPKSVINDLLGISGSATSPSLNEETDGATPSKVYVGTNEEGKIFVEMEQVILYKESNNSLNSYR
jgi:hypothetical protein